MVKASKHVVLFKSDERNMAERLRRRHEERRREKEGEGDREKEEGRKCQDRFKTYEKNSSFFDENFPNDDNDDDDENSSSSFSDALLTLTFGLLVLLKKTN